MRFLKKNRFVLKLLCTVLIFIAFVGIFYWVVADNWTHAGVKTGMVSAESFTPEISDQTLITQSFSLDADELKAINIQAKRIAERPVGKIAFRIMEKDTQHCLHEFEVPSEAFEDNKIYKIELAPGLDGIRGRRLDLEIRSDSSSGIVFCYGQRIDTGRAQFPVMTGETLTINGQAVQGQLVVSYAGEARLMAARWIFPVAGLLLVGIVIVMICYHRKKEKLKQSKLVVCGEVYHRYSYLLKQLVVRDFKVKYKASVLGVLWSFLNPLLMMLVYYFVFSNLFKSNIEHFPVYLMTGIVMMNYFSEATNLGLQSIIGSRGLITKVYMPKYIYPLSKVLSSAINMIISFIPLLVIMLIVGVGFHRSLLLIPFVILFIVMLCLGLSFILATVTVYFRDTQFLWGVIIIMLNFLTPIFYPEAIIPQQFIHIYHLNPLYQVITFLRTVTMNGVAPPPLAFLYCTLTCGVPLLIGIFVFKKNQDHFVYHL